MKINKATLIKLIKEELQVVLTNEEVEEMFGEEVREELEQTEETFLRLPKEEPKAPTSKPRKHVRTDKEQEKLDRFISAVDKGMKKEGTTPSMEIGTIDFSPRHPATIDHMERLGFDLRGMRRHNGGFRITLNKEEAAKLRDHMAKNPSAFFESKKEQNTMKIKKSELLALIKEEIMNEMDGLTMMDDPRDDDDDDMGMMQEGMDAQTLEVLSDVAQKLAPLLGVMSLPVLIGQIVEKLKEAADKSGAE